MPDRENSQRIVVVIFQGDTESLGKHINDLNAFLLQKKKVRKIPIKIFQIIYQILLFYFMERKFAYKL